MPETITDSANLPAFKRYGDACQDRDAILRMITVLSAANSQKELNSAAIMYVLDMSYERSDICLALKIIEMEKGWR